MKRFKIYIKKVLTSPVGIGFMVMHSIIVIFAFTFEGAGQTQPFHFYYEPLILHILVLIDLPGLLLAIILSIPTWFLGNSSFWLYLQLGLIAVCTSFQWQYFGYVVEKGLSDMGLFGRDLTSISPDKK